MAGPKIDLAEAVIETTFNERAIEDGFKKLDKLAAESNKSLMQMEMTIAKVEEHRMEVLHQSIHGLISATKTLGEEFSLVGEIIEAGLIGGAAGAGLAAVQTVLPHIIDSLRNMGQAYGFSTKNVQDHTQALKENAAAAEAAEKAYMKSLASAQKTRDDVVHPGETVAATGGVNPTEFDDALTDANAAWGAAEGEIKALKSGSRDVSLRQRVLKRLGGFPATEAQIKAQVEKERKSDLKKQREKLAQVKALRDELVWNQREARGDFDDREDFKRNLLKDGEDVWAERGMAASQEADAKVNARAQAQARLDDQDAADINARISRNDNSFGRIGGIGQAAGGSSRLMGIDQLWAAIQNGANDPKEIQRKMQAEAQLKATKEIDERLKNDVRGPLDRIYDKLNVGLV